MVAGDKGNKEYQKEITDATISHRHMDGKSCGNSLFVVNSYPHIHTQMCI